MKKKIAAFLFAVLLVFSVCGCSGRAKEQTFTDSGLTITLTDAFHKAENESNTVCYDSKDVAVFALKQDFETLGVSDLTVEEYAGIVLEANGVQKEIISEDGLIYFVFEAELDEGAYTYIAAMYKGGDAYWLIQFACRSGQYESLKPELIGYAKSVKV